MYFPAFGGFYDTGPASRALLKNLLTKYNFISPTVSIERSKLCARWLNRRRHEHTLISRNEPLNLQRFIIPAEETGGAPALSYLFGMSHSQQNDFEQMTFADICDKAREPFDLDKELAPIFLPSTATAKDKGSCACCQTV